MAKARTKGTKSKQKANAKGTQGMQMTTMALPPIQPQMVQMVGIGDFSNWWDKLVNIFKERIEDVSKREIVTKTSDDSTVYTTTIALTDEDTTSILPPTAPKADDPYWQLHVEKVKKALDERKEINLKIIEALGGLPKIFAPSSS